MGLQDSYTGVTDNSRAIYDPYRRCQTFTANTTYTISSVILLLYRYGNPGNLTVTIQETTAGKPNGSILTSDVVDANSLTTDTAGEQKTISFSSPVELTSGTVYAIVASGTGSPQNYVLWRHKNSNAYAGGARGDSINSGSTWTLELTDAWFATYSSGGEAYDEGELEASVSFTSALVTENVAIEEGVKAAFVIFSAALLGETFSSSTVPARPAEYSGDKVWGYSDGSYQWISASDASALSTRGGSRFRNTLIAVGHKTIYYSEF